MTRLLLACTVLAAFFPALAAQVPAEQTPPVATLHATTRLVVVDVVVTDSKGRPVHNLKPSDFTLTESGKSQSIGHVEEHTPGTVDAPAPLPKFPAGTFTNYSVAPASSALNVLLLDALNTPLEDQIFVRQ